MINLAGNGNCDIVIREELKLAGIVPCELPYLKHRQEVPSKITGRHYGWTLNRAWYYWVAKAYPGIVLPFDVAGRLHETHGQEVRVGGHCGAPAPREWYKYEWDMGVSLYHIDTQDGLCAWAEAVRELARKEKR